MTHPCGQGGEEVHRQQQRHHQLDHHGHHEGGNDDGDSRTSRHGCGESGQVSLQVGLRLRASLALMYPLPLGPVSPCQRSAKRSA